MTVNCNLKLYWSIELYMNNVGIQFVRCECLSRTRTMNTRSVHSFMKIPIVYRVRCSLSRRHFHFPIHNEIVTIVTLRVGIHDCVLDTIKVRVSVKIIGTYERHEYAWKFAVRYSTRVVWDLWVLCKRYCCCSRSNYIVLENVKQVLNFGQPDILSKRGWEHKHLSCWTIS